MKKFSHELVIIFAMTALPLCACQASPEKSPVVSKNDGSFDANAAVSASESREPDATRPVSYSDTFTSTDGSVEFTLNIDTNITDAAMPVVEVAPHSLTGEDVRRTAQALFGDAICYEARQGTDETLSQKEIQEKINRWTRYASADAIRLLYGTERESTLELVKSFVGEYTKRLETAPGEDTRQPCPWEFREESYYVSNPEDYAGYRQNDDIEAYVEVDGIPYNFSASKRNESDYKLNMMMAYPHDGTSPDGMDSRIFRANLCRTPKPTEAQMDAIRDKAERILSKMDLGQWQIDGCTVECQWFGDIPEYTVRVSAVPVFCGIPATRHPQLWNLKGDDAFASNYYFTDCNFIFSADGRLVRYELQSPVDITSVVNENTAVLPLDELMELAKQSLMLTDANTYGQMFLGMEFDCQVEVNTLDYGLNRVKVPNTVERYYYVPGITLYGTVTLVDGAGDPFYVFEEPVRLVSLNAVDGTRILQ